jgi:hypothetical protein
MKDQVRGKAEEIKGKVTGSRTEETKGKLRQQVGKAKASAPFVTSKRTSVTRPIETEHHATERIIASKSALGFLGRLDFGRQGGRSTRHQRRIGVQLRPTPERG